MKEKLFIFLALILLVVALIGLNAVSYVQKEEKPDDEFNPNRSTYHAGATGTRALYDLLAETGRKPMRWQEKTAALHANSKNKPATFVVIGSIRQQFTDEEVEQLLRWVSLGGKLVVIDRAPRKDLISTTANWQISADAAKVPTVDVDPSIAFGIDPWDQQQMTNKTAAVKPAQPTIFTRNVNAVQPSRFATSIKLENYPFDETHQINGASPPTSPGNDEHDYNETGEPPPIAAPPQSGQGRGVGNGDDEHLTAAPAAPNSEIVSAAEPHIETTALSAPVVHFATSEKALLADFPYGSGQIVFLTDPYIVSNAGIALVDNAQLAINVLASREGTIAFDEFHQGFGTNENQLLAFFSGTPVPAIFAQLVLLVGAILFTQSRRFARALPAAEPSRLSKLEYVSAMAELQSRTRAYDLAVENIYTEFRRRVAKSFGVDNILVSRKDLAAMIAERAKFKTGDIESLMQKCEDIIQGEATNKREVLEITSRLREIEEKLGLKRTRKQAFRK